jgi:hypothetical protein
MRKTAFITVLFLFFVHSSRAEPHQPYVSTTFSFSEDKSLVVLWTTGERDVFTHMLHMYLLNSKWLNWWEEITLVVWGPSAKLIAEDEEIRKEVKELLKAGIIIEACKACAEKYGVTDILSETGIEVKGMGKALTGYIKDESREVLIF